jgi:hypothetical protein
VFVDSAGVYFWIAGAHDGLSESFLADMDVGLLDGRKGAHLEHVTLDVVEPIIEPVKEEIDPVFLD